MPRKTSPPKKRKSSSPRKTRNSSISTLQAPVRPPPPSKQYDIHPPQPLHPGPSFLGSVIQGVGLGAGSSLGHRATDAFLGPLSRPVPVQAPAPSITALSSGSSQCDPILEKYSRCYATNMADCNSIYDDYFQCVQNFMNYAQPK
jgi:hypothetical protein